MVSLTKLDDLIWALYFINEMDKILINFEASNLDSINEPVGLANLHILLIKVRAFPLKLPGTSITKGKLNIN